MKKLKEDRSKYELKQQQKALDTKYHAKRKLTRDEASTVIQRQYHKSKQKRAEATSIATSILNDLIDIAPKMQVVNGELKKKSGRKIN